MMVLGPDGGTPGAGLAHAPVMLAACGRPGLTDRSTVRHARQARVKIR
jgi:hypothetical protein